MTAAQPVYLNLNSLTLEPEAEDEDINSLLPISLDAMLDASYEMDEEEDDTIMSTNLPPQTHSRYCVV